MAIRGSWGVAVALVGGLIVVACATPPLDSESTSAAQSECAADDPVCGGGPECATSGEQCTADADCCSGPCSNGRCGGDAGAATDSGAAAAYCSPAGATCAAATECCSGICNGTCLGGAANSDSGADSGLTPPPTPPTPPAPACKGSGDDCNDDKDCCSKQCWFSSCILG